MTIELREKPIEAIEIIEQSPFSIFIGVIEDADGTTPATRANYFE